MSFLTCVTRTNHFFGKIASWLLLLMLFLTVLLVLLRYAFNMGSIALQELITVFHASIFLLGAGYTLSLDGHVRVDIFYQHCNQRQRDWINAVGCLLFLLPFSGFLLYQGSDFFLNSLLMLESSPEPGGLPYLFLFKAILPLSTLLLMLQGLSIFLSCASRLVIIRSDEQ